MRPCLFLKVFPHFSHFSVTFSGSVWLIKLSITLSPLTPLEGFAFKKTVVSTISHGIPYTITHQKNGLLVEPENFKEFAESIIYLLKNKDKRDEFGLNGFNLVQELCNSKIMSKKTLELYEKVINR